MAIIRAIPGISIGIICTSLFRNALTPPNLSGIGTPSPKTEYKGSLENKIKIITARAIINSAFFLDLLTVSLFGIPETCDIKLL
jgi:hypothetical protein